MRRSVIVIVAAALVAGLPSSAAQAYTPAEKRAEKKQNRGISKAKKRSKKANKRAMSAKGSAEEAKTGLAAAEKGIADLKGKDAELAAQLASIVAAGQQLASGLEAAAGGLGELKTAVTALGGSVATIAENVGELGAGLEALEGSLTALGTTVAGQGGEIDALQAESAATEFGVAAVFHEGVKLGTVWTSDVPDDGNNAAQGSGTVVSECTGGDTITVRGVMRSSETDGGQGGAGIIVTLGDGTLIGGATTADNPDYDGVNVVDVPAVPKTSGEPVDADDGVEIVTFTVPGGVPDDTPCVIEGTAQFFDFGDSPGGTD